MTKYWQNLLSLPCHDVARKAGEDGSDTYVDFVDPDQSICSRLFRSHTNSRAIEKRFIKWI
ncbi:MAG: hypothetical protein HN457_05750 [Opitutales bacterium]|nr:hypothetical protein [Opitutales bacterium]MBT5169826.1 hypothetical protein [Opitutales bacterium]MBT5813057.1 hypothetical protein [Opitutales bacterium]MBT6379849.1 hypothetical protein [Opitutales bacterium]MBT6770626.1 hypothetical protein [Opitutales bacterium]